VKRLEQTPNSSGNPGFSQDALSAALQILASLPDEQRQQLLDTLQGKQVVE